MKICPFCKKNISNYDNACSNCHRVLVEILGKSIAPKKDTSQQTKKFEWSSLKRFVPISLFVLLIIFFSLQTESEQPDTIYSNQNPISVLPNSENTISELTADLQISNKNPEDYISLKNGTVLSKSLRYLNGLGELKIVNGTDLDAVAKLVNITTNKSIVTVYVQANSTYTINKIANGDYKLFFNLGNDWNSEIKAFSINSTYEVFEDIFDFITTNNESGEYIETKYSTFSVTLNPIIGGQAETENINPEEFANY